MKFCPGDSSNIDCVLQGCMRNIEVMGVYVDTTEADSLLGQNILECGAWADLHTGESREYLNYQQLVWLGHWGIGSVV